MNKRMKSLIVRAAVLAMIVGVLPTTSLTAARAQDPPSLVFSDLLLITGATTFLTPPIQKTGGSGNYSFTAKLCKIASDPSIDEDGNPADLGLVDCDPGWQSPGSYTNIVCGTGTAQGDVGNIGNGTETFANAHYTIVFVGGQGVLTGTIDEVNDPVTYPAILTGKVQLSPLDLSEFAGHQSNPFDPVCTSAFAVKAEVTIWQLPTQP